MPIQKPGKSKQDYGTPDNLIAAVQRRFGKIVCDLAATPLNTKCEADYYTPEMDSLSRPWAREFSTGLLWLNPPFANIAPWAEKCTAESRERHGLITLLVPASIGSNWFAKHVEGKAVVIGLSPRITFVGETTPYPKDIALCVFGFGLYGFQTWRWG
jgi:DNA (cytosine-5)-methyltransferase 1